MSMLLSSWPQSSHVWACPHRERTVYQVFLLLLIGVFGYVIVAPAEAACFVPTVALLPPSRHKILPRHVVVMPNHPPRFTRSKIMWCAKGKDNDDEENSAGEANNSSELGMAQAFRQLEALQSLGETTTTSSPGPTLPDSSSSPTNRLLDTTEATATSGAAWVPPVEPASTEQQLSVYTQMAREMESKDENDLYADVLTEMGGTATTAALDDINTSFLQSSSPTTTSTTINPSSATTEEFMNRALQEALQEVQLNNPSSVVDSILNDQAMMDEIEAIFERGSQQLVESLEQIRQEQQAAIEAQKKALDEGNSNNNNNESQSMLISLQDGEVRLAKAEATMANLLGKVQRETAEVEKAAQDLRQAQAAMDNNIWSQLRQGGLPKQAAAVGMFLFTIRSLIDAAQALGGDSSLWTSALIQGAIALACAAYLFL